MANPTDGRITSLAQFTGALVGTELLVLVSPGNASAGINYKVTASALSGLAGTPRLITAAGNVTVLASDVIILMQKTVAAATNINLPTSASRNGVPLTVKDYKGDANTNNITFVPSGTETIDGFSPADAITNGSALIDINYGKKTLYPLASGGWYL